MMTIKVGTIGVMHNDENLMIITKIENNFIYCHKFRGNRKTLKIPIEQFKPLIY